MSAERSSPLLRIGQRLVGVGLAALLTLAMLSSGHEMARGGLVWSIAATASGLLLLAAAWRNWPLLWNPLGKLLRTLLGEPGARAAFAVIAAAFLFSSGVGSLATYQDYRREQVVSAPDGDFPLGVRDTASVVIRLARSGCFGWCPSYELTVDGSGTLRFQGHANVDSLAPAPVRLGRAELIAILHAFERVDYHGLGDYSREVCATITDMPSVVTSIAHDGREKHVVRYGGCNRAPLALTRLEWRIDSIAGTDRWIGNGPDAAQLRATSAAHTSAGHAH